MLLRQLLTVTKVIQRGLKGMAYFL